MTRENPLTWEEWAKTRLLPLTILLFLTSSATLGMAIAETSITTNGIAVTILTIALLTIFYTVFNIYSCLTPSPQLRPKVFCVIYTIPIVIWLFLTTFELTEVRDIKQKANSYNSSYWGEGSGLSHGCSWADEGRYRNKDSYDRTCSLMKGRFSISCVVLVLLSTIFFSFLFGPKRISDREEGENARQARRDGREDAEAGAETGAAEQGVEGE